MGIFRFLVISLGSLVGAYGSNCVPETAECSKYWVKMETHRNLMESETELNAWCRNQVLFYSCLSNIFMGQNGTLSDLPTNLLISKMFANDLCVDGSHSRRRYLSSAACINQLNNDYCTQTEYLELVTPSDSNPPSRCSLSEKTFTCIAATMVMNCSFDAVRVYRYLLKLTQYGDEVCGVESSEGVPLCRDEGSGDGEREKLSALYYDTLRRLGSIPEQVDEPAVSSYETAKSEVEDSVITDFVRKALDTIADSLREELNETADPEDPASLELKITEESEKEPEVYRKTPLITEPFNGLLFYNYSYEYAIYWRQPDGFPVGSAECEHLLPSYMKGVIFRCLLFPRYYFKQACEASEINDEKITPELIRDIDPNVADDSTFEFESNPYWMAELNEYKKQKELREQSNTSKFLGSSTRSEVSVSGSKIPSELCRSEVNIIDMVNDLDNDWWKCKHVFSDELRLEIISTLLPDLTEENIPLMSGYVAFNTGHVYMYDPEFHSYESVTCSLVNECHPRGRGVYKCVVKPRKIEVCLDCFVETTDPAPALEGLRRFKTLHSDSNSEEVKSTALEGSGSPEDETMSETLVTVLLGMNEDVKKDDPEKTVEDIIAEEDDVLGVDISSISVPGANIEESPDVSLVFLEPDANVSLDDLVYAADEAMNNQQNEASYVLPSKDNYGLLEDRLFLLQAVPSKSDVDSTFQVLGVPKEKGASEDLQEI